MNLLKMFARKGRKKYHPIDKEIVKAFNMVRPADKRQYLCHAPFKSMTFFHTGDVLACWYNKLFPLGKYPDDTVHDIWFSQRADKLRDFISHNDLSYGCADCRRGLKAGNFYTVGNYRYDFLPEQTSEYPVSMDFQISNSCNLQCIMCNGEYSAKVRSNRENKELYDSPYDENFFTQIEPFIPHLKEASFSGGEPFFAKEFFKVWDLIIKLNPKINISVTTNGNILNEKVWTYLNALPFNISVSLDAITEATYSKIRVNGNFKAVMKNLELFSEYTVSRGTYFAVKICPMRQNWHELPQLFTFLNEKNIYFQYSTVIYPPYCSIWSLPSHKLKEIVSYFNKYSLPGESATQKENAVRFQELIHQTGIWYEEALIREQMNFYQKTTAELAELFINRVQTYLDEELNHLKEDSPLQIAKMQELVQRLIADSPSEEIALAGMQYYASVPIERWLAEIEIRDYEKNLDRFLQIGTQQSIQDIDFSIPDSVI